MKYIKIGAFLSLLCVQSYVNASVAAMKNYFWPKGVSSTCAEKATHFTSAAIIPGLCLGASCLLRDSIFKIPFLCAGIAHVAMHNTLSTASIHTGRPGSNLFGASLVSGAVGVLAWAAVLGGGLSA